MVDEVHHRLHYFRAGLPVSWPVSWLASWLRPAAFALALPAVVWAQYPGQVSKKSKDTPELRAVAVLEWTGEAGKPKACRIVPVSVYDGERLQDAGLYLSRPQPLALAGEVEYQLKENGKTIGLFDIKNAGQEEGSWVGYGEWKPVTNAKPAYAATAPPKIDDWGDDKPVLHRKQHPDEQGSGKSKSTSTASSQDDADRPKLHKKDDSSTKTSSTPEANAPAADSDRPVLHKPADNSSTDTASGSAPADPDRPTIKKPKAASKPPEDVGHVDSLPNISDPDRPRLQRGKSNADSLKVVPTLMGLPPDMQQAVAVSDAKNQPDHLWVYSWASPDDEAKMKAALEGLARTALGLTAPAAPAPAPAAPAKRTTPGSHRAAKPATPPPPPEPAPLHDEQFRVFELAYGAGATMVLTANTGGPLAQEKFVTLIAQPDLYGNLLVLFKNVTDGEHLDESPRMRLVDAVDAQADNRGELLFELRSETSRQFALYRVLRGTAERLFVSSGGTFGTMSRE